MLGHASSHGRTDERTDRRIGWRTNRRTQVTTIPPPALRPWCKWCLRQSYSITVAASVCMYISLSRFMKVPTCVIFLITDFHVGHTNTEIEFHLPPGMSVTAVCHGGRTSIAIHGITGLVRVVARVCTALYSWAEESNVGVVCKRKALISHMMTSSNGTIFRVTGPLCGEFAGQRWIPRTKASDAELWCFLWFANEQTVE